MRHRSFLLECKPERFKPRTSNGRALTIVRATPRDAALCRRLWSGVGEGFWTERIRWTAPRWSEHLRASQVSFWIASVTGEDIGCVELAQLVRGVKIRGFGVLEEYRGRGYGRNLLTAATQRAFEAGAPKVWLHTATDDHPHALPNYLAGGYRIIRERELKNPMPPRIDRPKGGVNR